MCMHYGSTVIDGSDALGYGKCQLADHIGGIGTHELCTDKLSFLTVGNEFDEASLLSRYYRFGIGGCKRSYADNIYTGGFCFRNLKASPMDSSYVG